MQRQLSGARILWAVLCGLCVTGCAVDDPDGDRLESELSAQTGAALPSDAKGERTVAAALVASGPITKALSVGNTHSLALRTDGSVWAWGQNTYGQLGNGTQALSTVPVRVTGLPVIRVIAAGMNHSLALGVDGSVWAWGQNTSGQLGDGTATSRLTPVSVTVPGGAVAIAGGLSHSLAIAADGSVYGWGANGDGQLGDGTTSPRLTPTRIVFPVSIVAISAGWFHSMALGADGRVWTWGRNVNGQIGNGSASSVAQLTPYQVSLVLAATAVAAGGTHSLALLSNQSVVAWGQNTYGQLGNGTTATAQSTPVAVALSGAVKSISTGGSISLAIDSTGAAWSWGQNTFGQLGDGTQNQRTSPVRVQGLSDALAVSAGPFHALAVRPGCPFWAWGLNSSGQLGNGTQTNQFTMIQTQLVNIYFYDIDTDNYGGDLFDPVEDCQPPSPEYVEQGLDCNDFDSTINPGATEVCDGQDNNCNGQVDDGASGGTWYRDADNDGYGNPAVSTQACAKPAGYVSNSADCNDANANVKPGATEVCNKVDDNCNGSVDEGLPVSTWYRDADADGRGTPSSVIQACSAPAGYVSNSDDCEDNNASLPRYYSWDADGDGYGQGGFVAGPAPGPSSYLGCTQLAGYVANADDCDDSSSYVRPGAAEVCDRVDNNCNGSLDEGCSCSAWFSSATVPSGGTATFGFSAVGSYPAGSKAYLYGRRNGVVDTSGSFSYDQLTFSFLVLNSPGLQGYYERYIVIRGPNNQDLCTTNTVYQTFLP
ncbi:RCC1 domain-containing protein [Hyalangium versicolor]|uniref:RCC1 domain-containing protein n=1 Tax=Hyalangium versicolor TaxID=2861190 RepID=UPI001CC90B4E|nr:MopE-related protein [Hyalangium versicolor]